MNIEETLKFLEPLYPITGAIHVGLGGPHNLNVYKTLGVEKLLLIEANETRCEIIKKHIPEDKDWKVVNQVVADIEGEAQYYELNNKNESGLIPPEKLKPIWPNIKLVEERTETVTTLDNLVRKYTEEEVRENYNLLVIDCLSSLSILKGAREILKNIEVVIIREFEETLIPSNTIYRKELNYILEKENTLFYTVLIEPNNLLRKSLFLRSNKMKVLLFNKMESELFKLQKTLSGIEKECKNLRQQNVDLSCKINELENKKEEANKFQNNISNLISDRFGKIELLFEKLNNCNEKNLDASLKQLEAFIQIQNYMSDDRVSFKMHGWSISPDFGMLLINLIEDYDFDAVFEFGSGVSTLILAKALKNKKIIYNKDITFLSFEHLNKYYIKSLNKLKSANLSKIVQFHFTPLVNIKLSNKENSNIYKYYDCEVHLEKISKNKALKISNILLVVDGPPQKTCKHARFPALPIVLNSFPKSEITILLDDYGRIEESETVMKWQEFLKSNNREFEIQELKDFEKQACLITCKKTMPGEDGKKNSL